MARRTTAYMRLEDLEAAPINPKAHASALIEKSIDRFGLVEIITLDERTGKIVAGHGRRDDLLARKAAGGKPPADVQVKAGEWLVPVSRGWASADDDEALAAGIALNQVGQAGGWILDELAPALQELEALDLGLDGIGFEHANIDDMLATLAAGRVADLPRASDEVPAVPKKPTSKLGDVWVLGDHRLLCGDARERGAYDRVLAGQDLTGSVIADPPYGVAIGAKNRALDAIDRAGQVLTDLDGDQGIEEVEALWKSSFGMLHEVMPPGLPYYIFGPQGGDLGLLLLLLLRDAGLSPRHILIWVKNRPSFSIGRLDYDYQHEPIVYGWQPGGAHHWHADGTRSSVLMFDRPQASPDHPTTKPVALIAHLVANSTKPGDVVLDPFAGSGTTLMACEQEGRKARCIELDPGYCDVIVARWRAHTGIDPILEEVVD